MLANIAYFAVLTPAEMLASKATAVVSETKDLKSVAEFSEPHSQIDKIRPNTQYDFSNNLAFIPGHKQWGCTFPIENAGCLIVPKLTIFSQCRKTHYISQINPWKKMMKDQTKYMYV